MRVVEIWEERFIKVNKKYVSGVFVISQKKYLFIPTMEHVY